MSDPASSTSTTSPQFSSPLLSRILVLPAWLEPRLRAVGAAWWRRVSQTDARAGWRWLATNWQTIAAWWLTIGLGLTAMFLLAALVSWQNPHALFNQLIGLGRNLFSTSGRVAGVGAVIVLVLSLPVLLPGALLSILALLALTIAVVMFGPLLIAGLIAFGVLFVLAAGKRGGSWILEFVLKSLVSSDEKLTLAARVHQALGFERAAASAEGKTRPMTAGEFDVMNEENRQLNRGGDLFLGYVHGKEFCYRTEKHVFIAAATRAGKGRDLIIPNLRRYPESVFVLDPKGENWMATVAERKAMGNVVAAFDPYGLTGQRGARFNPLATLQNGRLVHGADYLAEALVIGENDHWNESARGLIRALVLHLVTATDEQMRGRARDLPTLRELLTGYLDLTLEDMAQSTALDGLVSRLAETFIGIPPNEKGGIVNTARRGTKWLDNPELADVFRAGPDCISFDDLRDPNKRLSVFVCLPPDTFGTSPEVCRLLTTFALDTMMQTLTGRQQPVMFILDELAQLQRLPIVERAFTLGAGYGVQVWAVFQSIETAAKLYALDALYGSSGIRCLFWLADPGSVDFACKCSSGVFSPGDMRRFNQFDMLVLLDGENPLVVERLGAKLEREKNG